MAKQTGDGRIRTKRQELARVYLLIAKHPGCKVGELARLLNTSYHKVHNYLPSMERVGLLLSEDDKGRLWPFSCEAFNDYQSVWC